MNEDRWHAAVYADAEEAMSALGGMHLGRHELKYFSIVERADRAARFNSLDGEGVCHRVAGDLAVTVMRIEAGAVPWPGMPNADVPSSRYWIPGLGLLEIAGYPILSRLRRLEGIQVMGAISALGVAMCDFGIPLASIAMYERALREGHCLILAAGNLRVVDRAAEALPGSSPGDVSMHGSLGQEATQA